MTEKRNFGFDLVRSIAILLVLVGHGLGFLYSGEFSFFYSFLSGFLGVELFFILSGVLIGQLLIKIFKKPDFLPSLKNFVLRRWLRTLPLYFLMLLVYYIGNRFFESVQNNDVAVWKYIFFVQNFYELQPTFFGVSWSLSIEEWFYVLFPVVLFLIKKLQPLISTKRLFLYGITFFATYFLVMRFSAWHPDRFHFYEGARKIAFLRLDAISFGILAAWSMHFYKERIFISRYFLFISGLLILYFNQYMIFTDNYSNLKYFNTVYFSILGLGLAMLFPLISSINMKSQSVISSITFLSNISYSLYLVHWIFFRLMETSVFSFLPDVLKFIVFMALSILASAFLYNFFEKPILRFRDRFVPDK